MRFIAPVSRRRASGAVSDVYQQVRRDFGLLADRSGNSPFLAHSPVPDLLAGFWSVLYETVLVDGTLSRADKEAIAATVSRINACPFCLQTHALLAGVAGVSRDQKALLSGATASIGNARRRALVEWAAASRSFDSDPVLAPPFGPNEAPEAIGTAVAFHYLNRIVEVLQGHVAMDVGPRRLRPVTLRGVGVVARRAMRSRRQPGQTLPLLRPADLPPDLSWAEPVPHIAAAFAGFAAAVEQAAAAILAPDTQGWLQTVVAEWDGADLPLGHWPGPSPEPSDPEARLVLLTALAPYRVDDDVVTEFRRAHPGDSDLVGAVAWAAFAAARRIGAFLAINRPDHT